MANKKSLSLEQTVIDCVLTEAPKVSTNDMDKIFDMLHRYGIYNIMTTITWAAEELSSIAAQEDDDEAEAEKWQKIENLVSQFSEKVKQFDR